MSAEPRVACHRWEMNPESGEHRACDEHYREMKVPGRDGMPTRCVRYLGKEDDKEWCDYPEPGWLHVHERKDGEDEHRCLKPLHDMGRECPPDSLHSRDYKENRSACVKAVRRRGEPVPTTNPCSHGAIFWGMHPGLEPGGPETPTCILPRRAEDDCPEGMHSAGPRWARRDCPLGEALADLACRSGFPDDGEAFCREAVEKFDKRFDVCNGFDWYHTLKFHPPADKD